MSEFTNVTIVREATIYFHGNVVSRKVIFPDGSVKTLGFMQPGDYRFSTGAAEFIEIISGRLDVLLPGSDEWKAFGGGDSFTVQGNSGFTVSVQSPTDYCCSYL
ncbi:MAG TPA: pyrimidine/purine nucleoside phosphorylase [Spirochaetota bacterium]|nr:pyrimidine/purine nucleoside phosphorylase [Spirochaetota bacterium]HPJ35080.1 pyrimidine/purine nucleoside phosphorylase [Spirochaetota bacterium]